MFGQCSYKQPILSTHHDTALLMPETWEWLLSHRYSCKCTVFQIHSDRILYSGQGFLGLHWLRVCGTRAAPRPRIMLPTSNVMITDSSRPKARTKKTRKDQGGSTHPHTGTKAAPPILTQQFPGTRERLTRHASQFVFWLSYLHPLQSSRVLVRTEAPGMFSTICRQ